MFVDLTRPVAVLAVETAVLFVRGPHSINRCARRRDSGLVCSWTSLDQSLCSPKRQRSCLFVDLTRPVAVLAVETAVLFVRGLHSINRCARRRDSGLVCSWTSLDQSLCSPWRQRSCLFVDLTRPVALLAVETAVLFVRGPHSTSRCARRRDSGLVCSWTSLDQSLCSP